LTCTFGRSRRLARTLAALAAVAAMAGCAQAPAAADCKRLAALNPERAETAARADLQAGRARYMAVYGRHAVETPGVRSGPALDPAILEDASAEGPCGHLYARAVDYAGRYNAALARLRGEAAAR
jgi:hypothetical protein